MTIELAQQQEKNHGQDSQNGTGVAQMNLHELIRSIQFQQGHMPCYSEPWSAPCGIDDCPFSAVCTSHLRIMSVVRH